MSSPKISLNTERQFWFNLVIILKVAQKSKKPKPSRKITLMGSSIQSVVIIIFVQFSNLTMTAISKILFPPEVCKKIPIASWICNRCSDGYCTYDLNAALCLTTRRTLNGYRNYNNNEAILTESSQTRPHKNFLGISSAYKNIAFFCSHAVSVLSVFVLMLTLEWAVPS